MGYKLLGFVVWQGSKWYVRRRMSGVGAKLAIAGVGAAVVAGVLVAGRQAARRRPTTDSYKGLGRFGAAPAEISGACLIAPDSGARPDPHDRSAAAEPPIAIDRVERARGEGDNVRLRLIGRWLDPDHAASEHDPLLVVQLQGRRHRFAATREPDDGPGVPGAWQADFSIPSWAVPSRPGQAAVWVGNAVVAVGPPGSAPRAGAPVPRRRRRRRALRRPPLRRRPTPEHPLRPRRSPSRCRRPTSEPAATSAAPARWPTCCSRTRWRRCTPSSSGAPPRPCSCGARWPTRSPSSRPGRPVRRVWRAAHAELRHELEQLMEAVPRQRREFEERSSATEDQLDRAREELAMTAAARRRGAGPSGARARQEAEALEAAARRRRRSPSSARRRSPPPCASSWRPPRSPATPRSARSARCASELERLGAELAVMREQVTAHGGDLGEAQQLLADARALTEQLRGETSLAVDGRRLRAGAGNVRTERDRRPRPSARSRTFGGYE